MPKFAPTLGLIAGAAAVLVSTSSLADGRRPNPQEHAEISRILSAAGFTSWRKIERDGGKWEVEDARRNGRVYDVDIRGGRIVKIDLED